MIKDMDKPAVHDSFKDDNNNVYIIKEVTSNAFRIDFQGTQAWYMFKSCKINREGYWIVKPD